MTSLPTVLFFTPSEYGQANVQLATSYELALAGANVYIASFSPLQSRVEHVRELVVRHRDVAVFDDQPRGSVSFYECQGFPSWWTAVEMRGATLEMHPCGVSGALQIYSTIDATFFPWEPEEYLAAIESIKDMMLVVKPDVVVIDGFFYVAMDACQLVGQKFAIMLPNSIKDVAVHLQPHFGASWKYPALSSGFSFPLKWWQIPLNIYLNFRYRVKLVTSSRIRRVQALRQSLGIKPRITLELFQGIPHICPFLPETDFPFDFIPEEMVLCGPIVMPFDPIEKSDIDLKTWLDKGPTVMVNLGSHIVSDENFAREITNAFRIFLDYHGRKGTDKMQILWKVMPNGNIQQAIDGVIGKEIKEGRIKVVPWLNTEPVSILQHPNVACTVHHGGANSFFEGIWSGVPHVVLPVWVDTYDYAARVEFMNIGVFGNRRYAPRVGANELGEALVRVTGETEEAHTFREAAQRLKAVCRAKGNGRKLAAAAILKEASIET